MGGVPLSIGFTGVGTLHRGFFTDQGLLTELSQGGAACTGQPLEVVVTYEERSRVGRVVGVIAREHLRCHAPAGQPVDAAPLAPLLRAVASYRNGVGAAKDMRIYAFRAGLHVRDANGGITLWATGQEPNDGSTWSPCVYLDNREVCGEGDRHEGTTSLKMDRQHQARVAELLGAAAP